MSTANSPRKPSAAKPAAPGNNHGHNVTVFTIKLANVSPDQIEVIDLDSGVPLANDDPAVADATDASANGAQDQPSSLGESSADEDGGGGDGKSPTKHQAATAASTVTHSCHVCGRMFADLLAQRAHFRSSWHTANLQRKMRGEAALTEQEFLALDQSASTSNTTATKVENDDRGSDNDSADDGHEDDLTDDGDDFSIYDPAALTPMSLAPDSDTTSQDPAHRAPRTHAARTLLAFRLTTHPETLYTIHRAVLPTLLPWRPSAAHLHASLTALSSSLPTSANLRIAYLMLGGGHFAGAIFDNDKCAFHASVHRYTTRRKQGGSQSAQDNARHAKSAGASLRRYNEAALARDVWDQMAAWNEELKKAHIVFVVAPGVANKRTLLQHPEGLGVAKEDARIRGVPFTTRRAGFKEIVRVHRKLIGVGVQAYVEPEPEAVKVESDPPEQPHVAQAPVQQSQAEAQQDAGPEIILARKKKRKQRASRKTGTLPQAASDSSSGTDDEADTQEPKPIPVPLPSTSGPQRLGGRPAPSTPMAGLSSMVQGLGFAGMSAESRAALERERRARAAERRLGIASPPVHAVTPPLARVLTGVATPSMQPAAHTFAAQLAGNVHGPPLAATAAAASGPPCDECGQPVVKKALKKNGKQFCGIRCAAAAGKKDASK
ncbi:hypothetical protein BCR44DRAFT_34743 [Catenaria anguillulae PL171]|uniref:VLRF1 domain-containing protein n=1 Tax=Catenaria anguillulae PL171 TaxID=765915 RepID=A0A1Y2I2E2_9FUNG|nr:hypothetical protein BCR44DRAFT_34743 [Catenaria anguillulae PL171]